MIPTVKMKYKTGGQRPGGNEIFLKNMENIWVTNLDLWLECLIKYTHDFTQKNFWNTYNKNKLDNLVLHLGLWVYVVIIKPGKIRGILENEYVFKSIINMKCNIKNKTDYCNCAWPIYKTNHSWDLRLEMNLWLSQKTRVERSRF